MGEDEPFESIDTRGKSGCWKCGTLAGTTAQYLELDAGNSADACTGDADSRRSKGQ